MNTIEKIGTFQCLYINKDGLREVKWKSTAINFFFFRLLFFQSGHATTSTSKEFNITDSDDYNYLNVYTSSTHSDFSYFIFFNFFLFLFSYGIQTISFHCMSNVIRKCKSISNSVFSHTHTHTHDIHNRLPIFLIPSFFFSTFHFVKSTFAPSTLVFFFSFSIRHISYPVFTTVELGIKSIYC